MIVRIVAAAALVALVVGCGAAPPRVPAPDELRGLPDVAVELAPELEPDRVQVFDAQDGRNRLRNAVLDALIASGKGPNLGADRIVVTVTRFRLRSTGTGVWVGAFAGADMLDVAGRLEKDGREVRTEKTGTGGLTAGLVKPTADGRFNGLVLEAAKRLVALM